MLALIFLLGSAALVAGYFFYTRWIERTLEVSDERPAPSVAEYDGVDYVPAKAPILFGHHFSSIAGAGPIVGPVIAALAFGWIPAFVWIIFGAILIGGVHDYTTLVASLRHRGRSIAEVARHVISPPAQKILLAFIWLTLIYVLIVFLDLTATTFTADGTVATSSILFIGLAILFGLAIYRLKLSTAVASVIFVPLVFAAIFVGGRLPIDAAALPVLWGTAESWNPAWSWSLILVIYCYVASVTPVWVLLQPRDYLSSFLLYAAVLTSALGLLLGGFAPAYPGFLGFTGFEGRMGPLFPILFVTIACGAVSGFHSVISSGTTAKQLAREREAKTIGYGAMIAEGVVALIALATVIMLARDSQVLADYRAHELNPIGVFAAGMGRFAGVLGLPAEVGARFGALAISTFLLTTLDTCTRLGRFLLHEFFAVRAVRARFVSSAVTVLLPAVFLFLPFYDAAGNPVPAWKGVWPVFGTANQLLAGLGLLVVTLWVRREGKPILWVLLPTAFMFAITLTSLATILGSGTQSGIVKIVSGVLLLLAVVFVALGARIFGHRLSAAADAGAAGAGGGSR